MKKSFLSLSLALVLCLSLAGPAFAVDTSTYDDGLICITNVLDYQEDDSDGGFATCVSPAYVAPGDNWLRENREAEARRIPDDVEVTIDNYTEYYASSIPVTTYDGESVILAEPGYYFLIVGGEYAEGSGGGVVYWLVNIQAPADPNDPKPGTSDPSTTTGFTDVKPGDWFYEPVQWAVKEGVTNGTSLTTFSPNQDCTVAHILTFLWRANGSPKAEGDNPFSDVNADDWFYGAALWAREKGMVTGDTFAPNTPCTRSMAVKYLWQAAGSPSAQAASFTDVPAGADYAQAVNWAVEKGITNGTSLTTFSPSEVCTRGHIVTFLYRDLAK